MSIQNKLGHIQRSYLLKSYLAATLGFYLGAKFTDLLFFKS